MARWTKTLLAGMALGFAHIGGAGAGDAQAPETAAAAAVAISPQLPEAERSYLAFRLAELPPRVLKRMADPRRKPRFIVFDDVSGVIHTSRPEDVGKAGAADMPALPDDSLAYPGRIAASASLSPYDPGYETGTGPYRRVYTKPVKAIDAADAAAGAGYGVGGLASINCKAGWFRHDRTHSNIGFLYVGGWSGKQRAKGNSVDAGLQYNYMASVNPKSKDDYTPFISISNYKWFIGDTSTTSTTYAKTGAHIPCANGDKVEIEFTPSPAQTAPSCPQPDPNCATFALGLFVSTSNGDVNAYEWIVPNTAQGQGVDFGGWANLFIDSKGNYRGETPCAGCVFKYMTSIGQSNTPPYKADYADGSHYRATWSHRFLTCWATKCDANQDDVPLPASLTYCSEYPLWRNNVYNYGTRDCTNTPKGTTGLGLSVGVSGYSAAGETDAISLTH